VNQFLVDYRKAQDKDIEVSLCLVIDFDCIGCMDGVGKKSVPRRYATTMSGSKVSFFVEYCTQ